MAVSTKIEWCDATFNPWRGCTKIDEACKHCYADTLSKRNPKTLGQWGPQGTRVVAAESYWRQPLKWNREAQVSGVRRKVFCASLSDVFEDWDGPMLDAKGEAMRIDQYSNKERLLTMSDVRRRLFELIDQTPWLDWLLLTKRPENIRRMTPAYSYHACETGDCPHWNRDDCNTEDERKHRDNVWLGTSAGTQATADRAIPELLKCRDLSPVLFVSAEPLLEAVDLSGPCRWCADQSPDYETNVVECRRCDSTGIGDEMVDIDWIIAGGESGPNARPMHTDWARSIRDQCAAAGVPFFMKQVGGRFEKTTVVVRYGDDPFVRELYADWTIIERSSRTQANRDVGELWIVNQAT